jgi:hypothetical protein
MAFSRTAVVAALFLWSATTAQEERGLDYDSAMYGTEDELELTRVIEPDTTKTSASAATPFVGHFRVSAEQGFALTACDLIEEQFVSKTVCTCSISMVKSSTVSFGCEHQDLSCNKSHFCGRPVYTGTVSLDSPVFRSNFCLKNFHIRGQHQGFGDLCVSVDQSREAGLLGNCRAQLGTTKCKCSLCNGVDGIRLDCSDTDQSLISTTCDSIGLVTGIKGEVASVVGFLPSFAKQ